MRQVIIPHCSKIKSLDIGETRAETLRPSNQVIAYNLQGRQLTSAIITNIESVGKEEAWSILLIGSLWITLGINTVVVSKDGEATLLDAKEMIGSCIIRPNQLLTKKMMAINPIPNTEMLKLTWDGPDYIICEGILVGESG